MPPVLSLLFQFSLKGQEQTPKRVIGLVDDPENEFNFYVELRNGKMETIPRATAHRICPQLVIDFYRGIFEWKKDNGGGSEGEGSGSDSSVSTVSTFSTDQSTASQSSI